MTRRTQVLLWTDSTAAYLDAIKAAGLADRVAVDTLPRKEKPSAEQLARTEVLMAYTVPPGVLPAMPKLRWAQAMMAGVEGWIALARPAGEPDAHLRARHPPGIDAGEHRRRAVVRGQTLRGGGREPEARQMGPVHGAAADRQDPRHPRAGDHRAGRRPRRRRARAAGDRHAAPAGAHGQCRRGVFCRAHARGAGPIRLPAAAVAGDARRPTTSSTPSAWR